MNLKSVIFIVFAVIGILIGCKNSESSNESSSQEPILPPPPKSLIKYVLENGDAIDYIFHNLPISVNQTEQNSVRASISGFTFDPVYNTECTALGRMFIQADGETVIEAEIYFNPETPCHYFIFYENKQPTYASQIRQNMQDFLNELIKSRQNTNG